MAHLLVMAGDNNSYQSERRDPHAKRIWKLAQPTSPIALETVGFSRGSRLFWTLLSLISSSIISPLGSANGDQLSEFQRGTVLCFSGMVVPEVGSMKEKQQELVAEQ
ncbi:unnamed protein product [Calypogeia fissa]